MPTDGVRTTRWRQHQQYRLSSSSSSSSSSGGSTRSWKHSSSRSSSSRSSSACRSTRSSRRQGWRAPPTAVLHQYLESAEAEIDQQLNSAALLQERQERKREQIAEAAREREEEYRRSKGSRSEPEPEPDFQPEPEPEPELQPRLQPSLSHQLHQQMDAVPTVQRAEGIQRGRLVHSAAQKRASQCRQVAQILKASIKGKRSLYGQQLSWHDGGVSAQARPGLPAALDWKKPGGHRKGGAGGSGGEGGGYGGDGGLGRSGGGDGGEGGGGGAISSQRQISGVEQPASPHWLTPSQP